jgi:hypothetical protein
VTARTAAAPRLRGGGLLAGAAGLRPGLRVAQPFDIPLANQVFAARPARLQVAVLDPSADRHVAHAELVGGLLNGEQLVLFHAGDRTASCEKDNTLQDFTGILITCIIRSQVMEVPTLRRRGAPRGSHRLSERKRTTT